MLYCNTNTYSSSFLALKPSLSAIMYSQKWTPMNMSPQVTHRNYCVSHTEGVRNAIRNRMISRKPCVHWWICICLRQSLHTLITKSKAHNEKKVLSLFVRTRQKYRIGRWCLCEERIANWRGVREDKKEYAENPQQRHKYWSGAAKAFMAWRITI